MLKSRKLEGRKFRRQYSIGSYIVDFCCPAEKLIIELDGAPHGEYHKIQEDENRDKFLESFGLTINHPGRNHPLQYFGYHCAAATPPSKGGENIMNELYFDIPIRLSLLILPVKSSSDSLG